MALALWLITALTIAQVYCLLGGPKGLGEQPEVSRVNERPQIFQPVAVFSKFTESIPQWLNLPFR